jgi:hypothetical protein
MKKFHQLFFTALLLATGAQAQYKKASFLQKDGRIYDVAGVMRLNSGGRSSSSGLLLAYGREFPGKRLHYWSEFELASGTKYNYNTTSFGTPVTVSGKSKTSFSFRVNLGCYILENNDENKLMPFLNLMTGYVFAGGGSGVDGYTVTPSGVGSPFIQPSENENGRLYLGGGGGLIYRITNVINLRANAGYSYITSFLGSSEDIFETLTSHPYVNLGIRFRIIRNDE